VKNEEIEQGNETMSVRITHAQPGGPSGDLSHRALAMLRAIVAGRAHLQCGSEPDLFIDGLPCCDQFSAHELSHAGLIRPAIAGKIGQLVPAMLTPEGHTAIANAGATVAA